MLNFDFKNLYQVPYQLISHVSLSVPETVITIVNLVSVQNRVALIVSLDHRIVSCSKDVSIAIDQHPRRAFLCVISALFLAIMAVKIIEDLHASNVKLKTRVETLKAENATLKAENKKLHATCELENACMNELLASQAVAMERLTQAIS